MHEAKVSRPHPENQALPARGKALGLTWAILVFACLTVLVTWPLVPNLSSRVLGGPDSDTGGSILTEREILQEHESPFTPGTIRDFNAPEGLPLRWVLQIGSLPSGALIHVLSRVAGAETGYSIFMLLGFLGTAVAMFLLARKLTGDDRAGLIAGAIYAFYPFSVVKAFSHVQYMHCWVIVLVVWRLLVLAENPTRRNGLLAGAATALAMWFTYYFVLIAGVAYAGVAAIIAAISIRTGKQRAQTIKSIAWSAIPVLGMVGLLLGLEPLWNSGFGVLPSNPVTDLAVYSARVREYLVPSPNNPVFGSRTGPYLAQRQHGSNPSETSLYLGWSVIALAAVGLAARLKKREVWILVAVGLVVIGLVWAHPPEFRVGRLSIPAPSLFVFQLTKAFRVFSRFVILTMLGLSLLAGAGTANVLKRLRRPWGAAVAAALLGLVMVDLWARPELFLAPTRVPEVYSVLAKQPKGMVAEYPLQLGIIDSISSALWYQQVHGNPIINGYLPGSESESVKLELADLGDDETAGSLSRLGVRYILVRPDYKQSPPGAGFEPIFEGDGGTLYSVTAPPAHQGVDALSGFTYPEGDANKQFRWLVGPAGRVRVWSDCGSCTGHLEFLSYSWTRTRTLKISDGSTELYRGDVPTGGTTVSVPVRIVDGEVVLTLTTVPPPQIAVGDPRALGVDVEEPRFVPDPESEPAA